MWPQPKLDKLDYIVFIWGFSFEMIPLWKCEKSRQWLQPVSVHRTRNELRRVYMRTRHSIVRWINTIITRIRLRMREKRIHTTDECEMGKNREMQHARNNIGH